MRLTVIRQMAKNLTVKRQSYTPFETLFLGPRLSPVSPGTDYIDIILNLHKVYE